MQSRKGRSQEKTQGAPTQSIELPAALALPQPTTNTRGAGEETAGKWATFFLVAIGIFMATLDSSIVNISLPLMARDFGVPLSGAIEWVIIAYLVATTAILLTAGRLADLLGHKVVWIAGLMLFTASSALCGLAPSLGMLIAARTVQGVGGAL